MKTHIRYNPRNRGTRILWGPAKPGARQIVLGEDKATRQVRKTKKGAARLLLVDDEKHFLSPEQRESLLARAGKTYQEPQEVDPLKRRKDETENEYVTRINRHIARMVAE